MFSAHRYLCNWSIKLSEPKSQGFHKETAASILVKKGNNDKIQETTKFSSYSKKDRVINKKSESLNTL